MSYRVKPIIVQQQACDEGDWVQPLVTPLTPEQGLQPNELPWSYGTGLPGSASAPMLPWRYQSLGITTHYKTMNLTFGGIPGNGKNLLFSRKGEHC